MEESSSSAIADGIITKIRFGLANRQEISLVSPFLLNDSVEDMDESCTRELPGDKKPDSDIEFQRESLNYNYDCLKEIDVSCAAKFQMKNHLLIEFQMKNHLLIHLYMTILCLLCS